MHNRSHLEQELVQEAAYKAAACESMQLAEQLSLLDRCDDVALDKVRPTLPEAQGCGECRTVSIQHSGVSRVRKLHLLAS